MTTITYFVALPFLRAADGSTVPGEAMECQSAEAAIVLAESLSRVDRYVGVIAFSRTGDLNVGKFEDAVVLKIFGDLPADLAMLS